MSAPALSAALLAAVAGPLAGPPAGSHVGAGAPPTAIRDVRLAAAEDAPRVTLILRDGRIAEQLDAASEVPPGFAIVEGQGRIAVPAFIDAYAHTGCPTPEPEADQDVPTDISADVDVDMRLANRKGIQPTFRAALELALEDKDGETWRENGFGALLAAPHGELLAGTSVLATTRSAAARDVVLRPDVFLHAAFRASGRGYPSTLMGYVSQLRQFFADAEWHAERLRAYAEDGVGSRPPFDAELEAARELVAGRARLMCEAETHRDVERWLGLADEFGLALGIAGGRDAWRVAERLAERDVPVVLTLDWGDEVDDPDDEKVAKKRAKAAESDEAAWTYDEPLAVLRERRRLWEEGRDCALRLSEAGVRFAFGSGDRDAKKLVKAVRELVEAGLPSDVALRALTAGAAEILGVGERLGALEIGHDATLALWTDDPLAKGAKLAALVVDGHVNEFEVDEDEEPAGEPDEGVDVTGRWKLVFEGPQAIEMDAELTMDEDGTVTGTYTRAGPEGEISGDFEGHVSGTELSLRTTYAVGETSIDFRFTAEIDGDELSGTATAKAEFGQFDFEGSGERIPDQEEVR